MMHGTLREYRTYLEDFLQQETARTYTHRLGVLLQGQDLFQTVDNFDMDKVLEILSEIKYKNHFSQSKNALFYFCKFKNIKIDTKTIRKIEELEDKTKKKYRKLKKKNFKDIEKKIHYLRNKKMKLCYKVLITTGLRVSELSQIKKEDCNILENEITFHFLAKGGKKETSSLQKTENFKLFNDVLDLIKNTKPYKKVFYSANYLQMNAKKLGFSCHDLRRACAKLEYKKTKSKEATQQKLRHTNVKNTNIYLKSKIQI